MGEKVDKADKTPRRFRLSRRGKIFTGTIAVGVIAGAVGTVDAWSYVSGLKAQKTQAEQTADLKDQELKISKQLSRQYLTDLGQPDASGEVATVPVYYGPNDTCVSNLDVATARDGIDTLYLQVPDGKTGTVGDITAFSTPSQEISAKTILYSIAQSPGSTACHK